MENKVVWGIKYVGSEVGLHIINIQKRRLPIII
jgi:hypothetical protein